MMRYHVKPSVNLEKRTCDKFGIKKRHVLKICHDISTLKFEVVDVLYNNGMKPAQDKVEDVAGNY